MCVLQELLKSASCSLQRQWTAAAAHMADDDSCYQLVLQQELQQGAKTAEPPCLDVALLLKARGHMMIKQPAQAGEAVLLLLERCLVKEQLAAGLISSGDGVTGTSSSNVGSGDGSMGGAAAAGAAEDAVMWSRVRPMPPGRNEVCIAHGIRPAPTESAASLMCLPPLVHVPMDLPT